MSDQPWRTMPHPWAGDTLRRIATQLPGLIAAMSDAPATLVDLLREAREVVAFDERIEAVEKEVGEAMDASDFTRAYAILDAARSWATSSHPSMVRLDTLVSFMDTPKADPTRCDDCGGTLDADNRHTGDGTFGPKNKGSRYCDDPAQDERDKRERGDP